MNPSRDEFNEVPGRAANAKGRTPDDDTPVDQRDVFRAEWTEIITRRSRAPGRCAAGGNAADGPPEDLVGLALSGGGIRSATFSLGVLQMLAERSLLGCFDYLSTVSGGGFVGAWWSAWLSRDSKPHGLFPPREKIEPLARCSVDGDTPAPADFTEGSFFAVRDPVHHLRLFANYLTPRKGALSPDTWRAVAIITRNLSLTWLLVMAMLLVAVWLGQLVFVAAGVTLEEMASSARDGAEIGTRLRVLEAVGGVGGLVLGLCTVVWLMLHRGRGIRSYTLGLVGVGVVLAQIPFGYTPRGHLWLIGLVVIVLLGFVAVVGRTSGPQRIPPLTVLRNWTARAYAIVLVLTLLVCGWLGIAGFGHYALSVVDERWSGWATLLAKAVPTALAIAGATYTAFKTAPTGGGVSTQAAPDLRGRIVLAVTPPLILLVVSFLAAELGTRVATRAQEISAATLRAGTWSAILVLAGFALVDGWLHWSSVPRERSRLSLARLRGISARSLYLALATCVLVLLVLLTTGPHWSVLTGLIAAGSAFVVGIGWMADPNMLSLHEFYRARLIRAYLGASNPNRGEDGYEIRDAAAGDDVDLTDLHNCDHGAPYHLVNTTLNLVGGSDLTTAQRSAASFVLSRRYCGSWWTGYRPTAAYMGGRLSLGTAAAISGAAVNPSSGAITPSAALVMLMSVLNLRLGFWVPTPYRSDWRTPQARLWPFYLLWESLSQTNTQTQFCHLSDGGHFDNSGLYPLVARGCRYILAVDAGEDPRRDFVDLGTAIRRCRIDFNAEIEFPVQPLGGPEAPAHLPRFHVGTIRYDERHVKDIGWSAEARADPTGVLVVIKPTTDGSEPVDVGEYGREQPTFPQQTTIDQFFDEAQFESYRQLGMLLAEAVFPRGADEGKTARQVFERIGSNVEVLPTTDDAAIHRTLSGTRQNAEHTRDLLL